MVAINFSPQFADLVASGAKRQTIRQKARCKVGDKLQLYTGQRTKKCRKLADAICSHVFKITMPLRDNPFITPEFAKADGFNDANEMQWWFRNRYKTLIFEGYLIKWELS
jgi:hypothetical protein